MRSFMLGRRAAVMLAATAALTLSGVGAASAASADLSLQCQARSSVLGNQNYTQRQSVEITAPAQVAAGNSFDLVVQLGPTKIPSSVNGITVKEVKDLKLTLLVPANSTYVSAKLTGGDVPNPTITQSNGKATVTLPGTYKGGATIQLPTVTATLKAGNSGTIQARLGGTSYADPALTLNAVGSVFGVSSTAPTSCYPNPDPILSTTTITS